MNKALHIMYEYGTRNTGGAASAASRLHLDMLERGIDSRVVCAWGEGRQVYCLRTGLWWLAVRVMHKLTGKWSYAFAMPGFEKLVQEFQPDEVHVHWMRRPVVSWRQLEWLHAEVPRMYVHLHDLWPLEQKEIVALEPTFVAYSDWVVRQVRERGYRVERRELILDKCFRNEVEKVGGQRKMIILFGCKDGRSNPDKGFGDLEKALALLPEELKAKVELRIFGEAGDPCETSGVRTVFLGSIDEPAKLREEYCAANCFAFPSVHETMGMTKLEALACSCPVVAFDREACAEGIVHGKTGYVAKNGDIADFAKGLEKYLK